MHTEQIDSIIKSYCKKFKKVNKNQSIPYVVRSLDKIVTEMYTDLHALRNVQRNNIQTEYLNNKKGHCC